MSTSRIAGLLAVSLAVLLVVGQGDDVIARRGFAQDEKPPVEKKAYKLAVCVAKKDVLEKETRIAVSVEGKTVVKFDLGGNVRETSSDVDQEHELTEKYTDTILEATETGEAKKAEREYSSSVTTTTRGSDEGDTTQKEETPLDGKTFVITRGDTPEEGFDVKYDGPKDEVPEKAMRALTLDEQPFFLLPGAEVAAGETWEPTSENLKKFLMSAMQAGGDAMPPWKIKSLDATGECKLKEVVEEEGRRRATVSYKIEAEIELDPKQMFGTTMESGEDDEDESPRKDVSADMAMKTKITGEFELCLLASKFVRHEFSGGFELELTAEQSLEGVGTIEMNMTGKGTMEKKESWKATKEE